MSQEQVFLVSQQKVVFLRDRFIKRDQQIASMLSDCEMIGEFEAILHFAIKRERKRSRKKKEKELA